MDNAYANPSEEDMRAFADRGSDTREKYKNFKDERNKKQSTFWKDLFARFQSTAPHSQEADIASFDEYNQKRPVVDIDHDPSVFENSSATHEKVAPKPEPVIYGDGDKIEKFAEQIGLAMPKVIVASGIAFYAAVNVAKTIGVTTALKMTATTALTAIGAGAAAGVVSCALVQYGLNRRNERFAGMSNWQVAKHTFTQKSTIASLVFAGAAGTIGVNALGVDWSDWSLGVNNAEAANVVEPQTLSAPKIDSLNTQQASMFPTIDILGQATETSELTSDAPEAQSTDAIIDRVAEVQSQAAASIDNLENNLGDQISALQNVDFNNMTPEELGTYQAQLDAIKLELSGAEETLQTVSDEKQSLDQAIATNDTQILALNEELVSLTAEREALLANEAVADEIVADASPAVADTADIAQEQDSSIAGTTFETYPVQDNDTIWTIAQNLAETEYGLTDNDSVKKLAMLIIENNADVIGDNPNIIIPGQNFELPLGAELPDSLLSEWKEMFSPALESKPEVEILSEAFVDTSTGGEIVDLSGITEVSEPSAIESSIVAEGTYVHTITSTDTLNEIIATRLAEDYNISANIGDESFENLKAAIMSENGIQNENIIITGQTLNVPTGLDLNVASSLPEVEIMAGLPEVEMLGNAEEYIEPDSASIMEDFSEGGTVINLEDLFSAEELATGSNTPAAIEQPAPQNPAPQNVVNSEVSWEETPATPTDTTSSDANEDGIVINLEDLFSEAELAGTGANGEATVQDIVETTLQPDSSPDIRNDTTSQNNSVPAANGTTAQQVLCNPANFDTAAVQDAFAKHGANFDITACDTLSPANDAVNGQAPAAKMN